MCDLTIGVQSSQVATDCMYINALATKGASILKITKALSTLIILINLLI